MPAVFAGCLSVYTTITPLTTVLARVASTDLATTAVNGPLTMWAQPIFVRFQQQDLSLFPTSTATSTQGASPSRTPSQPSDISAVSPVPIRNPDPGLSTGAKAGICVGSSIGGLIVLFTIVCFFRRKRKARKDRMRPTQEVEEQVESHKDLSRPRELQSDFISRPGELQGDFISRKGSLKGNTLSDGTSKGSRQASVLELPS